MNRSIPKGLSVLIMCALTVTMLPVTAFAAMPDDGEDVGLVASSQVAVAEEGEDEGSDGSSDLSEAADEENEDPGASSEEVIADPDLSSDEAEAQDEPVALEERVAPQDSITAFVTRLYQCVLNREPDAGGLKAHSDALRSGTNAAEIIWTFFGSPEFASKPLSNASKVDAAYAAMLDRAADPSGKANWTGKLNTGMSMRAVIAGFCGSPEFKALCARWGVVPGTLAVVENRDKNQNVTAFVQRLYQKVLGRTADAGGLNAHTGYLAAGGNAANLIWTFFGSPEFSSKPLSNASKVDAAYAAMLDRAADASGKANWTDKLDTGMSMRVIVAGFCESPEFKALCAKWGVVPGTLTVVENRDKNQNVTAFVQRLYQKVLGRAADAGGLNAHVGSLLSGGNAADLVRSFFSSQEFLNRGLSNADKIESIYLSMLDRPSDPAGKANWLQKLDSGESLNSILYGFIRSDEFKKLCEQYGIRIESFSGDAELDRIIDSIIARYGTNLRALYNYVASYPYISGSKYPTGNWTPGFAKEMYRNGGGNCYRYAALFEWLAKAAGYDARAVAGHALNRQGGWNAHGWVEIRINGTTYVCDPQSTHAISGRNFYMVTYGNAPLTYRTW